MRTIFETGFGRAPWTPGLGVTFEELLEEAVQAVPGVYRSYQERERAEEERKRAQAQAQAAQAQAQAAQSQAQAAQAQAAAADGPKILGIPRDIFILGGIGLAAVGIIIAVTR
jgi:multidrug efflux pump subunit AcrA (membrane-fusion protein)